MKQVKISIDGKQLLVENDKTIYQVATYSGIYIPGICNHPDLPPSGECGLCIIEIEGQIEYKLACVTRPEEGMIIRTDTPAIRNKQKEILKNILQHHPSACLTCWRRDRCKPFDICLRNVNLNERCVTCPKNGRCELQKVSDFLGLSSESITYTARNLPVNRDNPFFELDYNLCITCGRCVRACNDLRGIKALDFIQVNGHRVAGPRNKTHTESGCKYCFTCVEVCPTGALVDLKAGRYGSFKEFEEYVVPCKTACPAHIDIPKYVYFISKGQYSEALATIREKVPFPGVLGRVCVHPCEQACRRGELNKSQPVCIKFLKRFAADNDKKSTWKNHSLKNPSTGKRVAVIGSGPAGLTAAYYLAKKGHAVTVFEALPKTGGMMRVGIPRYRLPADILDAEINEIIQTGVEIKTNSRITGLSQLFDQGFHAIFVGIGAHKGTRAAIPGEDLPGVMDGVDFLRAVSLEEPVKIGKRIGVIGGGNSAVDCARTALRLGAHKVTMFYRRTRVEMPAAPEEVEEALHEGVEIVFLCAPTEIRRRDDGALELICLKMKLGEPDASGRPRPEPIPNSEFITVLDNVIAGIGQIADIPADYKIEIGKGNVIKVNPSTMETSQKGVFAGGDVVSGPASVINAIAHGRQAAISIDKFLGGDGIIEENLVPDAIIETYFGPSDDFANKIQPNMPCISDDMRFKGFTEVELGYNEVQAIEEAKRCLRCDMRLRINSPILPPAKIKTM